MLAAVSVDLDEIGNYFAIHGLDAGASGHAVYDVAIARLLDWAGALCIPLTIFAVGADLERPANAAILKAAHARGHEIANHSYSHKYDLVRRDYAEQVDEIARGADAIERAVGVRPAGFRAPGYTVSDTLFSAMKECGVGYDSSVFPCPAYYAAKTAAIAAIALRGRQSRSIVDDPRVLTAPMRPYRLGAPYWKRGNGLREVPIQVTRGLRLPYIGTTLTLAGPRGTRLLTGMCVGEPLVNLELHGIDVLDKGDGLAALAPHQPDVRVPLQTKLDSLSEAVVILRKCGYEWLTLRDAVASQFSKSGS
jgi:hypothetical protein